MEDIEPLPDIDFNLRCGNTLVGYATREEVKKALQEERRGTVIQNKMLFGEDESRLKAIEEKAGDVDRLYKWFRKLQEGSVPDEFNEDTRETKAALRSRLETLAAELDTLLAGQYGIDTKKTAEYRRWQESHQPFHWFVEFYGIMVRGGFDVIIGNPPYVEYSKVIKEYTIRSFISEECGNLYAYIIERVNILAIHRARISMIIPHSAFCTDRMKQVINIMKDGSLWISTYDIRPSKLFLDVDQRLAVYLQAKSQANTIFSTKYNRWMEGSRGNLFDTLKYSSSNEFSYPNSLAKVGDK